MSAELRTGPVRVLVPASSANLGPGFDSAGLALGVYDELIAMVTDDEGVLVEVAGEGSDEVPRDERHLVVQAMQRAFDALDAKPPGFVLRCRNAIPHGRGLGSSAAAIIGGMVLARAMVAKPVMTDADLLTLATEMESHPDNLAAALHGGFTVAWLSESGAPGSVRMDPHPDLRAVLAIPTTTVPTSHARQVLPDDVAYSDAVHNVSRAALLVHAMTEEPALMWEAMSDRMHQHARVGVYPESVALVDALRAAGIAAAISGAGPSVIVVTDRPGDADQVQAVAAESGEWVVHDVPISGHGALERPIEL